MEFYSDSCEIFFEQEVVALVEDDVAQEESLGGGAREGDVGVENFIE